MWALAKRVGGVLDRLNGIGPDVQLERLHPRDFAGMLQPVSQ